MKKKLLLGLILITTSLLLSGCQEQKQGEESLFKDFNKVADYLYKIHYKDYKYDENLFDLMSMEEIDYLIEKNSGIEKQLFVEIKNKSLKKVLSK